FDITGPLEPGPADHSDHPKSNLTVCFRGIGAGGSIIHGIERDAWRRHILKPGPVRKSISYLQYARCSQRGGSRHLQLSSTVHTERQPSIGSWLSSAWRSGLPGIGLHEALGVTDGVLQEATARSAWPSLESPSAGLC